MTPAGELLADEILRGGPIPLRRFMEVAIHRVIGDVTFEEFDIVSAKRQRLAQPAPKRCVPVCP